MCVGTSDVESMWAENSSNCFAILGFDVFLDHRLRPYVIEVNRSPSFTCDAPLDRDIKYGVVSSALKLLRLRPSEKTRSVNRAKQECRERLLKPRPAPQVSSHAYKWVTDNAKRGSYNDHQQHNVPFCKTQHPSDRAFSKEMHALQPTFTSLVVRTRVQDYRIRGL